MLLVEAIVQLFDWSCFASVNLFADGTEFFFVFGGNVGHAACRQVVTDIFGGKVGNGDFLQGKVKEEAVIGLAKLCSSKVLLPEGQRARAYPVRRR